MAQQIQPTIGEWYKTVDDNAFEVVAFDDNDGSIEIQYADGDVEELDVDTWEEMVAGPVEPSEEWSAGFDNLGNDEYRDVDIAVKMEDW